MNVRPLRAEPTDETTDVTVQSFEAFYGRQYRRVLALAVALTGDRSYAEDLTQDAFLSAYSRWDGIREPDAWIRSTVTNKAMSWWRRHYAFKKVLALLGPTIESSVELPPESEIFWAEVRKLPGRQAQAIALYYLEGHPVAEIARVLNCSSSTARTHLSRGRHVLASRLELDL